MPIYEYQCSAHGLFEELRPMQRSAEGAPCPACREQAPRVLSPTRTSLVSRTVSAALARNEKSQHAPEVCTRGHRHAPAAPQAPPGATVYRGRRPWVIEHG